MQYVLFTLALLAGHAASAQHMPAYVIYDAYGNQVAYSKMVHVLNKGDVILFGEQHNNPIAHWLQLEVTKALHERDSLRLGAEMLETDNQQVLQQYLAGSIDATGLDTMARLWPNYLTDYAPLVDFAREHELPFVATNIPRRYANRVYRGGFGALDSVTDKERRWMAPLPIVFDSTLPTYQKILEMAGAHGTMDLVRAQAIKDATMAHFILANYREGSTFLHYNGAYHSDFYEGIGWYLQQARPDLEYVTISTVSQEDISQLEAIHEGKADFVICVDADMTTTY